MRSTTIREKLYDYIRFADEKKVKAIYTMVADDMVLQSNPWEDPMFIAELDRRITEYEQGVKMSSWEEVKVKASALKR